VPLRVRCAVAPRCRGTLRLRTRAKKPRTLAQGPFTLANGATKTFRPKLTKSGRTALRRSRRILARAEIDLGTGGVLRSDVTLRR
jgi:hypothetical protein